MQYLITVPHFINSTLIPAKTLVGDNTPYPWKAANGDYLPPSLGVVAVDAAAKTAVATKFKTDSSGNVPLKKK